MIELPDATVVKFSEEEIRSLKGRYIHSVPEGDSWFAKYIIVRYPNKYIESIVTDWSSMYTYVILV